MPLAEFFASFQEWAAGLAPSTLAQWFGAVGTIAAVLVALFKDPLIAWRRRPRLDATCTKDSPWTAKSPIVVQREGVLLWSGYCYYVRAKIGNSGNTRAEKVQVYAEKLAKLGADGQFAEIPDFIPLNLKWSNLGVPILDGISPKMGAFCDILALCDPANPTRPVPTGLLRDVTIGELQLEVVPLSRPDLLAPGTYRLTLRIAAANAKPIDKVFEFKHTGAWVENDTEMRRDCLGVSLK